MNFNISFKTLDARRLSVTKSLVNINNNSTISHVTGEENKMNVGFIFSSNYEPNIGIVRIEGELMVEDTPENIEEAVKEWERTEQKKLPKRVERLKGVQETQE